MTMSGSHQPLPPTWTLARLYEEQQQYLDALAAYELLRKTNPDPQVDEAIERLLKKILIDSDIKYNPIIDQIFTPEDKIKFKIAPSDIWEAYEKARSHVSMKPEEEEVSLTDVEEEEEPIISVAGETFSDFEEQQATFIDQEELMRHIITAKENLQSEDMSPEEKKAIHDMSVIELIDHFQAFLGTDKKITELKIRDLIEFWQDIQLEYRDES
jgi:hypothetical protein